jgi:tRNA dimethylallyltransferase
MSPTPRAATRSTTGCATRSVACAEIRARGSVPIVVGGTNLYIKAFLEGLFEGPEPDETVRAALQAIPQADRRAELERVDPAAAARIHPNDERRTVRALEVYRQTGVPITEHQKQWDRGARDDARLFGLTWPTEPLNRRINARVKEMMAGGLLDEVTRLRDRLGPQAREALGYKQLLEYLSGGRTLDEAVETTKIETRRFAKNQRTWLRRLATPRSETPDSRWFSAEPFLNDPQHPIKVAESIVDACLKAREGDSEEERGVAGSPPPPTDLGGVPGAAP